MPVDGFYEWAGRGRGTPALAPASEERRPLRARRSLGALARPSRCGGRDRETFTILTTEANRIARPIHDRMPVVVAPESFDPWLSGEDIPLGPFPPEQMAAHPVSRLVNDPANDNPECVAPAAARQPPGLFDAR